MSNTKKTFQVRKYYGDDAIKTIQSDSVEGLCAVLLKHYPAEDWFDVYDSNGCLAGMISNDEETIDIFFKNVDSEDLVSKNLTNFLNPAGDAPDFGEFGDSYNPDPREVVNIYLDCIED